MAEFIRQSWVFPVLQSVHILGLAVLVGTVCLVDLRLLGVGIRSQTPGTFAAALAPWTAGGLLTVLVTGPLMFGADITRYVDNPAFVLKMGLLGVALAAHFTLHRITVRDGGRLRPARQKAVAVLSLLLWSSVILAGRAIADFDLA